MFNGICLHYHLYHDSSIYAQKSTSISSSTCTSLDDDSDDNDDNNNNYNNYYYYYCYTQNNLNEEYSNSMSRIERKSADAQL